jgi:hypothetical protein
MADDSGTPSLFDTLSNGLDTVVQTISGTVGSAVGSSIGKSIQGAGVSPAMPANPGKSIFSSTSGTSTLLWIGAGVLLILVAFKAFGGRGRRRA